jgi:hypothetical protein
MDKIETARLKYKPERIKCLLIAEAPPKKDSERFFYFENVLRQDRLFIELMKYLYPKDTQGVYPIVFRHIKDMFLTKFKTDGFYLIDSIDIPFHKVYSTSQKVKILKEHQGALLRKVKSLIDENTEVISISASVYNAYNSFLSNNDIQILNTEHVDFPGSGGQKKFNMKMARLIQPILY